MFVDVSRPSAPALGGRSASDRGGVTARLPRIRRRPLAVALAFTVVAVPALGLGGLWATLSLLLLAALIAASLANGIHSDRGAFGLLEWMPAAFLLGVFGVTALGLAGWLADTPVWGDRLSALITWGVLVAAPLTVAVVRGGAIRVAETTTPLVTFGAAVVAPLLAAAALPFEGWSRLVTLGSDFPRHTLIAFNVLSDGSLDYSASGYPRSIHSAVALTQAAAGDTGVASMWQATQGVLVLMLGLTIAAVCYVAARTAGAFDLPRRLASVVAPTTAAVLMLVGVWGTAMLPDGFLTSFQAGLILAAAATMAWYSDRTGDIATVLVLPVLAALMTHAWLILTPLVAVPALWLVIKALRQPLTRIPVLAIGATSALVALPIVARSVGNGAVASISTTGATRVPSPTLGWLLLIVLTGLSIALLSRKGARCTATFYALVMYAFIAVLGFVLLQSGGALTTSYYFIKTAATPTVLLIGLAVPAALWSAHRFTQRSASRSGVGRRAGVALIAATTGLMLLYAVQAPSAERVLQSLNGDLGQPAVYIPLVEQVTASVPSGQGAEVLVWGLSPYLEADAQSLTAAGRLDYIANGVLLVAGYELADQSIGPSLLDYDAVAVCRYLQAHPDTVRITGPSPNGALSLLSGAGCPDDVVDPQSWISIALDPVWFSGTQYEGIPYGQDYASWEEVRGLTASPS